MIDSRKTQIERKLPAVLSESEVYSNMSAAKKTSFLTRLYVIEELVEKFELVDEDYWGYVDSLELEIALTISLPAEASGGVSAWLIHNSWVADADIDVLATSFPPDVMSELIAGHVSPIDGAAMEIVSWLASRGSLVKSGLERLYSSRSYDTAIASLLFVDAVLAGAYAFLVAARFNSKIS